jgi:putative ABC transport system permease protein
MTLAVANILQHKVRSLISIFAVSLGITLLLILVGMTNGSIKEVADRIQNVGADMIVQRAGATSFFSIKSGILPVGYQERIETIPGVKAVSPIVTWTTSFRKQLYVVYGIDPDQFSTIGGELKIVEGRGLEHHGEVIIDSRMAGATGLAVGDEIELLGTGFHIVGISKEGIGARIFVLMDELQTMLHQENRVSLFFVKCTGPETVKPAALAIEQNITGVKCQLLENFADEMARSMSGLREFIGAVTATTLIVSLLVILLAMYTTVLERTKEIGILKSLGASKAFIMRNIIFESTLLTVSGVLLGFVLTFIAAKYLRYSYPLLTIEITPYWILIGSILGIAGGFLGAMYPASIAVRQDPVKALSYE